MPFHPYSFSSLCVFCPVSVAICSLIIRFRFVFLLYFLSVSITVCFNNSPDLRNRLGCGHLRWSVAKVGAEAARAAAARCRERDSGGMRERERLVRAIVIFLA